MLAWRIVRPVYAAEPLSGAGAALWGSRWNSVGVEVVHAATSRPLAVLEMLVHVRRTRIPMEAILIPFEIPDNAIADVPELPKGWNEFPYREESRATGDQWINSGSSLALFVPSAIIPAERNILINPAHKQIGQIRVGKPEPHAFDRRLFNLK